MSGCKAFEVGGPRGCDKLCLPLTKRGKLGSDVAPALNKSDGADRGAFLLRPIDVRGLRGGGNAEGF